MAETALVERVTFAGGAIGPALPARADLGRYQVSVETMENYLVLVEGGAMRRPGTRFVLELLNEAQTGKMFPFRLTASDHYMIVINFASARFIRNGGFLESSPGVPYQVSTNWIEADLPRLRLVPRGNAVIGAAPGKPLDILQRNGLVSWTLTQFNTNDGPFDAPNLNTGAIISATGTAGTVSLIASSNVFIPSHVGTTMRFDEGDLSTIANWTAGETGIGAGELRRYNGNVYLVISGTGDVGVIPPTHLEGDVLSHEGGTIWRYIHGPFGVVRITVFVDAQHVFADVTKTLPQSVNTVGTSHWALGSWNAFNGFPTLLAWAGQRMYYFRNDQFWASGLLDPQDLFENGEDDRAFSGRLLSPDPTGSNVEVLWAIGAGALVVGSSDIEWIFRATTGVFGRVTGKTIDPKPDSNEGSIPHIPALVDGGAMFAGRSGKRLQYARIDPEGTGSERLGVQEVSVGIRDMFVSGIVAMAWQRDPQRVLWIVLGNGSVAAMTWMPKEKVLAFHRHPMVNAFVEDVAVIPSTSAGADDVYFIVRRTINGATRRYVELLQQPFVPLDLATPTAAGAWFVDCGLRKVFDPAVTVIGGLSHLEGQEVAVFVDGAMQKRKTVTAGSITLDKKGKDVLIGLPIRAELTDLPRNLATQAGPTMGEKKSAREVNLHLLHCGGGSIGTKPRAGEAPLPAEKFFETGNKSYQTPVKLFSGLRRMLVECESDDEVRIRIVNDDAMPCTVLGMSPHIEVEETD